MSKIARRLFQPSVRRLAWSGGLVIAALALQAGYEIWQGYHAALRSTEQELSAQARVIAEQTARSVQAIEVVLRDLAERVREQPALMQDEDVLPALLRKRMDGLVQSEGLVLVDSTGGVKLASHMPPSVTRSMNVSAQTPFSLLRVRPGSELLIDQVRPLPGTGRWVFPIGLRLEDAAGNFLGVVGAPARVDYFQNFYRDGYGAQGTRVALIHRNGWLLARQPAVPESLGKRIDVVDRLLPPGSKVDAAFTRLPSPVDGADHFAAVRAVPGYPLIVAVSKDYDVAMTPWIEGAKATALRTLVLCLFAAGLLWAGLRQLARAQRAQRELQVSQQRYSLAAAGSDMGLWDWDIPNGTAFVSTRARELLGLPLQPELQSIGELRRALAVHAADQPRFRQRLADHLHGTSPYFELEYRVCGEGEGYHWVHVRALCTRSADGRPARLAGSVIDVDQRKRAQEALQRSEEHYALAMAGSRGGHWVWNTASDEMFVSDKFSELFGLPADHPVSTREAFFRAARLAPEDLEQVRMRSAELISGSVERADYELRVVTPQGERWIQMRAQRFEDVGGEGLRIAGVTVDITERKRAELARQHLEEQLRQAQKMEAIGTLAGGIAHDFNNILAGILGYGEMAQKEAQPGSALRRHIDASLAAALRAKSLVERILAFSRSGMGQRVPVHVESVVQEALDALQATLPAGVQVHSRLAAGDAGVLGDPTQIHQVVMNLCLNAAQAMKSAGTINVELELVTIEEACAVSTTRLEPGRYLKLSVEDRGAGMSPELLSRIFDPFFTTKEVGVGTGLGLSMVHGIVSDLDGGIDVRSTLGEGSCFTVYLPVRGERVVRPTPRAVVVELGKGECVMVVDDEESLVGLAEEALAELGYEPVGFMSPESALEALRHNPGRFDLLLSDEAMPGMTGTQLVERVRELAPDLKVVMMSGFVTPALQVRARELGIVQVLNKPLMAAELGAALAQALRAQGPHLANIPRRDEE
ncbi:ATP-binding protein [Roseateles sp. P5_E11]